MKSKKTTGKIFLYVSGKRLFQLDILAYKGIPFGILRLEPCLFCWQLETQSRESSVLPSPTTPEEKRAEVKTEAPKPSIGLSELEKRAAALGITIGGATAEAAPEKRDENENEKTPPPLSPKPKVTRPQVGDDRDSPPVDSQTDTIKNVSEIEGITDSNALVEGDGKTNNVDNIPSEEKIDIDYRDIDNNDEPDLDNKDTFILPPPDEFVSEETLDNVDNINDVVNEIVNEQIASNDIVEGHVASTDKTEEQFASTEKIEEQISLTDKIEEEVTSTDKVEEPHEVNDVTLEETSDFVNDKVDKITIAEPVGETCDHDISEESEKSEVCYERRL